MINRLLCLLFGHRTLTDNFLDINIGDAKFNLGVCVRCRCFVAKPKNYVSELILYWSKEGGNI